MAKFVAKPCKELHYRTEPDFGSKQGVISFFICPNDLEKMIDTKQLKFVVTPDQLREVLQFFKEDNFEEESNTRIVKC